MTIETKFDIGQTVYVMTNNKVSTHRIGRIVIEQITEADKDYICRYITDNIAMGYREESLFATKQELLDSL